MKSWILPGWSGVSLTLTLGSPQARLSKRARRVRYAVATGGDASWRLEARRRRSPARSDRRRGYVYEANEKTPEIPEEPNFESGRQPELGSGLEP
jgi:hypothetical protein